MAVIVDAGISHSSCDRNSTKPSTPSRPALGELALKSACLVHVPEDRRQPQTVFVAQHFVARRGAQMPTAPVRMENAKRERRNGNVIEKRLQPTAQSLTIVRMCTFDNL